MPGGGSKLRLVTTSLLVTLLILSLRLAVYALTNSLAVLADAFHSLVDILGNVFAVAAVAVSSKGPDADHSYGHEKAESLGTLFVAGLLTVIFAFIVYESLQRALAPSYSVAFTAWSSLLLAFTMSMDMWRARALSRGARLYRSTVLEADALHYTSDFYATGTILALSVVGTLYKGPYLKYLDMAVSVAIAGYFAYSSLRLAKTAVDELMDRTPTEVVALFREVASSRGLPVERVRARKAGPRVFLDAVARIPPGMTLEEAHRLVDEVEEELRGRPGVDVDVTIHMEPQDEVAATIARRVEEAARREGVVRVHGLELARGEGGVHVRFHVEAKPDVSVEEAKRIADELKREVESTPGVSSVVVHVEPAAKSEEDVRKAVERVLSREGLRGKLEVADVKVVKTEGKTLVDIVCKVPRGESIEEAHRSVGRLEGVLREELGEKYLVTVCLEPT